MLLIQSVTNLHLTIKYILQNSRKERCKNFIFTTHLVLPIYPSPYHLRASLPKKPLSCFSSPINCIQALSFSHGIRPFQNEIESNRVFGGYRPYCTLHVVAHIFFARFYLGAPRHQNESLLGRLRNASCSPSGFSYYMLIDWMTRTAFLMMNHQKQFS